MFVVCKKKHLMEYVHTLCESSGSLLELPNLIQNCRTWLKLVMKINVNCPVDAQFNL